MSILPTLTLPVALLLSYLLGSLPGSLLVGLLKGVDIRTQGSGNAGATNALRTQGYGFALLTLLFDVGKGAIAAWLIASTVKNTDYAAAACGFAAVLGHCFPLFFGFRGGKGAGTALGAFALFTSHTWWIALLVWLVSLVTTGYVGFSTIISALSALIALGWLEANLSAAARYWASAAFVLIALMHYQNLARMIDGVEHRFDKARFWRRWLSNKNHEHD